MKKPSPTQAKLLRFMSSRELLIDKKGKFYSQGSRYPILQQKVMDEFGKVRESTINVCVREGWLEKLDAHDNRTWDRLGPFYYKVSRTGFKVVGELESDDFRSRPADEPTPHQQVHIILNVLKRRHPLPEWIFIPELSTTTGGPKRIIDAYAMNCWRMNGYLRIAYEIKLTRADFKKEIEQPTKREPAMRLSNQFYFVCPPDVIWPGEVPVNCGLIYVNGDVGWEIIKKAYKRDAPDPNIAFMASALRKMLRMMEGHEWAPVTHPER